MFMVTHRSSLYFYLAPKHTNHTSHCQNHMANVPDQPPYSPLLWHKGKLLNTWRCKLLHSPRLATPLPDQTHPHSPWQSTRGSSMCAHGLGSAPASWQRGGVSGIPGWGGWRGTPFPGRAGASPPSPPLQTATKCQGNGKRSRSWRREGAPGWGELSCTCCIEQPSRTPWCGARQSVCRSRRALRSWSRRPTGCSTLYPGPSCPCGGCTLGRRSGSPEVNLWAWMFLVREMRLI